MGILSIYLFGGCKIVHSGYTVTAKITKMIQGLLAFLVLHRQRTHPRDILATLFWGDQSEERARNCLSTALWRLRRILEPSGVSKGTYLLTTNPGEVGFNRESDHWLDVAVFEEQVTRILAKPVQDLRPEDVNNLNKALSLYTSELLEGFYDDWALRERERLRSLHLKSLMWLLGYWRNARAFEESLNCGLRVLNLDPLREEIHREVIRLYMAQGQRTMAIRQYQICCRILDEELGVSPMEETQALYAEIVNAPHRDQDYLSLGPTPDPTIGPKASPPARMVKKIERIIEDSQKLTKQLMQMAHLLKNGKDGD